jgi:hypothetical protein
MFIVPDFTSSGHPLNASLVYIVICNYLQQRSRDNAREINLCKTYRRGIQNITYKEVPGLKGFIF